MAQTQIVAHEDGVALLIPDEIADALGWAVGLELAIDETDSGNLVFTDWCLPIGPPKKSEGGAP